MLHIKYSILIIVNLESVFTSSIENEGADEMNLCLKIMDFPYCPSNCTSNDKVVNKFSCDFRAVADKIVPQYNVCFNK